MTRRSSLGPFSSLPASISWSITYFVNYTRPEPAHHCSLGSISMSSTFIVVVVYFFILFCCHLLLSHGIFNFFKIFISNWWYPHTPSHGYGFGRGTNIGIRTRTPPYPSQIPARVCVPLAFTILNWIQCFKTVKNVEKQSKTSQKVIKSVLWSLKHVLKVRYKG